MPSGVEIPVHFFRHTETILRHHVIKKRVIGDPADHLPDLSVQFFSLDRFAYDGNDFGDIERLGNIIKNPVPDGLNGGLESTEPADDDNHYLRIDLTNLF